MKTTSSSGILKTMYHNASYLLLHCVKNVQMRSYFPVFGLNTEGLNMEIYGVNIRIQSEYRKIRTRNNSLFGHFSRSIIQKENYKGLKFHWNNSSDLKISTSLFQVPFFNKRRIVNFQNLITSGVAYQRKYNTPIFRQPWLDIAIRQ